MPSSAWIGRLWSSAAMVGLLATVSVSRKEAVLEPFVIVAPATAEVYALSLHDALPILVPRLTSWPPTPALTGLEKASWSWTVMVPELTPAVRVWGAVV